MTYVLNGASLDPDTQEGQAQLAQAHEAKVRVVCVCCKPHPEMYIAKTFGKYQIKRMPDTGAFHASDCPSYEPPEELSGLGQVQGSAIDEDIETGKTVLKLDFPLSVRGTRPAPVIQSGVAPTEAKDTPRKLTLTAMLHYLWHEAELVKWVPAMNGKRWWGIVQHALRMAAFDTHAKGSPILDRLFIPEPFKVETKDAATARRQRFFSQLSQSNTRSTQLGILIAEYKAHEPTRMGGKFLFKHLPGCAFFAGNDFLKHFEKVFEEKLMLADMIEGGHVIAIATFHVEKAGYPMLHELGMMLTDKNWLPIEHLRELELVSQAVQHKRRFTKSLRFNLAADVPIASIVVQDTNPPTAMFVANSTDEAEALAEMLRDIRDAEHTPYNQWVWAGDVEMPTLPTRSGTANATQPE